MRDSELLAMLFRFNREGVVRAVFTDSYVHLIDFHPAGFPVILERVATQAGEEVDQAVVADLSKNRLLIEPAIVMKQTRRRIYDPRLARRLREDLVTAGRDQSKLILTPRSANQHPFQPSRCRN